MFTDGLWAIKITKLTAGAKKFVNDSHRTGLKHIQKIFPADNKFVSDEYQQISPKIL